MAPNEPVTFLCLASYFKGGAFMRELKRLGCRVLLITRDRYREEAWPWDSIDEVFYMPDMSRETDIIYAVSYLARTHAIDRIVPMDDYDVEMAAALREHLRVPGMGDTTARYFRDKLAMRVQARDKGILVPDFVHVLNYDRLREFMAQVPPPWVFKPRSEAGSIGIRKIQSTDEFWPSLEVLGDRQSFYLLEHFIPGDVFHVDSLISEREVVFTAISRYGQAPMKLMHEGGVFSTQTVPTSSPDAQTLQTLNREVIAAMGMVRGVTHAEYIKAYDGGQFYFLEMAGRVGGANIDRVVEAGTGVHLWHEWARIEVANARGEAYSVPQARVGYAGMVTCLAQQEWPDTSPYNDPEIVWRLPKHHHVGLLVASDDAARVQWLIESYSERLARDFLAVQPPPSRPVD